MQTMKIVTLASWVVCCAWSVSAAEPNSVEEELRGLKAQIKQLEQRIRELEGKKQDDKPAKTVSLAEAVEQFNSRALMDPIGKTQPPLTEEEVIAAIRWADHEDFPVTSHEFAAYKKIAETKKLPPGAELEVISRFVPNDEYEFKAWSVRLRMPRSSGHGSYAYSIRQRWISSTPWITFVKAFKQSQNFSFHIGLTR